ncbi:hypothetical protein [Natrialba sp. INN-245]|uniref:hypothetical protein n=1 Tax=Natrialba sp. INN-245 TaxID=2690967 RepID=UPI0013134DED|nr:hypothetical protein [Natrialba sp. INN-245]MWV39437.1 hypothetical protein [Natrialba sp. INN-245]
MKTLTESTMTPTSLGPRLDRTEWRTLGLFVVYVLSLSVVYAVGDVRLWLAWAIGAVILVALVMIAYNQSPPPE